MAAGEREQYAERTTTFQSTSTATNGEAIGSLSVTFDVGSKPIEVIAHFSNVSSGAAFGAQILLMEDGSPKGDLGSFLDKADTYHSSRRLTPAAGQHSYSLNVKNGSAGTAILTAGLGTGVTNSPGYIWVREVST